MTDTVIDVRDVSISLGGHPIHRDLSLFPKGPHRDKEHLGILAAVLLSIAIGTPEASCKFSFRLPYHPF